MCVGACAFCVLLSCVLVCVSGGISGCSRVLLIDGVSCGCVVYVCLCVFLLLCLFVGIVPCW